MIKNLHKTDYGLEGTMEYPLFKTEIDVLVSDENYAEYAEKCASYLVNMPDETLIRLCRYITRYCDEYRSLLEDYMTECLLGIRIDLNIRAIITKTMI